MFFSLFSSISIPQRLQSLRDAESNLLEYAKTRFSPPPSLQEVSQHDPSNHEFEFFDTPIEPPSIVTKGLSSSSSSTSCQVFQDSPDFHKLHGIKVTNKREAQSDGRQAAPLVLLHGYCNGSLYFYRNLMGLSHFHFAHIYAIDMYGWGLSSRPSFDWGHQLSDLTKRVAAAEQFFVESLESWRQTHNLPKMTLAGHSMGGYLSVAYAERYPHRVERLILLSPVGVPRKRQEDDHRIDSLPFYLRTLLTTTRYLFERGLTPGTFLRSLPLSRSKSMVDTYVLNRIPAITCEEERKQLSEYLYQNSMLPGSGEHCLSHILTSGAFARVPLVDRITVLNAACGAEDDQGMEVHFVYGENDWMDYRGGLDVQRLCFQKRSEWMKKREREKVSVHSNGVTDSDRIKDSRNVPPPKVFVHGVRDAGHLLMLDNYQEFNAALIIAAGGRDKLPLEFPKPVEFFCDEVDAIDSEYAIRRRALGEAEAAAFFRGARWNRRLDKDEPETMAKARPPESAA